MLINAHWLKKNIKRKNIKILDASWYLPNINRNPKKEYTNKRIPKAAFFDIDNIKGKDIIIIEDIVDTGDTVSKIRNKMINKANSVAIAAFLLKPDKAKLNFEIDWVGFEIPDEFVVGYGLDYNQKFRNLKGIYQGIEI